MSEEEIEEDDEDDSDEVPEDKTKKEEMPEESSAEAPSSPAAASQLEEDDVKKSQTEEKELKERTEIESTPAINEWEHFDMVNIVGIRLTHNTTDFKGLASGFWWYIKNHVQIYKNKNINTAMKK